MVRRSYRCKYCGFSTDSLPSKSGSVGGRLGGGDCYFRVRRFEPIQCRTDLTAQVCGDEAGFEVQKTPDASP
jgi:hypothetical protein